MASIGTGYDLSSTTYSPDGRIFQVEYAHKAVENSGTAIALRVKDGVVFAVEKIVVSKMLEPTSNRRIHTVDSHIGMAISGLVADGRQLVNRGRSEATQYRDFYGIPITGKVLAERISNFIQVYTLYGVVRPFGCAVLVGCVDKKGPQLYMVDPSGSCYGYYGCAIGKGTRAAKTELEKLDLANMTAREAVKQAARIIYSVHDDVKDKSFVLELSWVCEETKNLHQFVPDELKAAAEEEAKAAKDREESGGD
eukprot:TRINITY_DN4150_c0_g1_i1.p1 TRINITY_DN4150_c0_g1~~TRINITY_DN4150_c0_g1_i1.p1  ORF type:complete len:252 (-),score=67.13 TRINITY_DN4150_c0_g1_i1:57-812(-)